MDPHKTNKSCWWTRTSFSSTPSILNSSKTPSSSLGKILPKLAIMLPKGNFLQATPTQTWIILVTSSNLLLSNKQIRSKLIISNNWIYCKINSVSNSSNSIIHLKSMAVMVKWVTEVFKIALSNLPLGYCLPISLTLPSLWECNPPWGLSKSKSF